MLRLARWTLFLTTVGVVISLGWYHAHLIGFYDFSGSSRFEWSMVYIVVLSVAAYGVGLPDLPRNVYQFLWSAIGAAAGAALTISVFQLVMGTPVLPRFTVFWSAMFLVPLWSLTGFIAARGRRRQRSRDRLLVVAGPEEAEALEIDLARRPERRATVAAVLAPTDGDRLLTTAAEVEATVVVLSREAYAEEAIVNQAAALHESGLRVRTLSLFYDEWLGKLPHSELERVALMFDIGELHRARYGRMKRGGDLIIGMLALPVFLASLPVVLIGNLIANRGPLFYRQERVGRSNQLFTIWKLRTMRASDDAVSHWTTDDDPRVTRFGRVLRRTHIDELPQAINLLKGELTAVGPRPEQPRYVDELSDKIRFYRLRHLVRPGISGWAQVKYDYGSSDIDAMEKLQYEFWYLRHQSLTLDARILGRTLRNVLGGGGR
ncbi:MAG: sugar transferase [Acidimicrobiales bacterium]